MVNRLLSDRTIRGFPYGILGSLAAFALICAYRQDFLLGNLVVWAYCLMMSLWPLAIAHSWECHPYSYLLKSDLPFYRILRNICLLQAVICAGAVISNLIIVLKCNFQIPAGDHTRFIAFDILGGLFALAFLTLFALSIFKLRKDSI